MFEFSKQPSFNKYKNIIGDTKDTIEAIQKYIKNYSLNNIQNSKNAEEKPADSINRILNSTVCEETNNEIKKIIDNL